jgi:hypothetical protein
MAMKETLDDLYRRGATERASGTTDRVILNAANVQAKRRRTYRQWRHVGIVLSVVVALWVLMWSSDRIDAARDNVRGHYAELTRPDAARDNVREHYAELTRPYLLSARLQTTTSEESVIDSLPGEAQ